MWSLVVAKRQSFGGEKGHEQFGLNNCLVQCVSACRNLKRVHGLLVISARLSAYHCFWFLGGIRNNV